MGKAFSPGGTFEPCGWNVFEWIVNKGIAFQKDDLQCQDMCVWKLRLIDLYSRRPASPLGFLYFFAFFNLPAACARWLSLSDNQYQVTGLEEGHSSILANVYLAHASEEQDITSIDLSKARVWEQSLLNEVRCFFFFLLSQHSSGTNLVNGTNISNIHYKEGVLGGGNAWAYL